MGLVLRPAATWHCAAYISLHPCNDDWIMLWHIRNCRHYHYYNHYQGVGRVLPAEHFKRIKSQHVNRDHQRVKPHSHWLPSFFLTSALDLDSVFSSLFDLAGDTVDVAELAVDDEDVEPADVAAAWPDLVWSAALEPQRAHCNSWSISGATPSSRLILANTRSGSTPASQHRFISLQHSHCLLGLFITKSQLQTHLFRLQPFTDFLWELL